MKKTLLLFLLILPVVWFLFQPGFFPSHDGEWMVVRLSDFHRSFVSGQIPVRWAARLNYSYGYPVFNFLYPLSLYLGEGFYLLGFSFVNSIKLVFILSFFLSGLFMFLWVRRTWGDLGGLVAAVFYVYAPYRLLDVYVRGSIGEALSFVFLPLIFLMLERLSQKKDWRAIAIGAIAYASLLMSHNIMGLIFTYLLGAYVLYLWWQKRRFSLLISYFWLFVLGLGLACFFWLPALVDKQFIILDWVDVAYFGDHFPTLKQLFLPDWGYGVSIPGPNDEISFQIGLVHLLGVALSLFVWKTKKKSLIFFLAAFLIFFGLMFSFSAPVWKLMPSFWRIQFPWRLLAVTTLVSSFLAGSVVHLIKTKARLPLAAGLIILVILLNLSYTRPEFLVDREEGFYTTNEATTTVKDEYLPIWVKEKPIERAKEKVEVISGKAAISNLAFNSKKIGFNAEVETGSKIQINTLYFPGWQVRVNDKEITPDYQNDKGIMELNLEPGSYQVIVEFKETPIRLGADLVSLASLVLTAGVLAKRRKR